MAGADYLKSSLSILYTKDTVHTKYVFKTNNFKIEKNEKSITDMHQHLRNDSNIMQCKSTNRH
jgi:hypothetical protein